MAQGAKSVQEVSRSKSSFRTEEYMQCIEHRPMNLWGHRFYMIILAIGVFLILGCGKSNYLKVGENARVTTKEGLYIRADASAESKKVGLVPFGQEFQVLAEGATESIYSIKSRWYKVSYRGKTGWLWGGLASSKGAPVRNGASENSKGGFCIGYDNDCKSGTCGYFAILKGDGTYYETLDACGETGYKAGTWRQNGNSIEVDYTVYPSCYDSCGGVPHEKYTEMHKHSGRRVYQLLPNNKATYVDEAKGHREKSSSPLNVTRL